MLRVSIPDLLGAWGSWHLNFTERAGNELEIAKQLLSEMEFSPWQRPGLFSSQMSSWFAFQGSQYPMRCWWVWSKEPLSIQNALKKYLLGQEGVLGAKGGCSLRGEVSWSSALCSGSVSCLVCLEMLIFLPASLTLN